MGNLKKVAPGILELGGIQLDTIKHEVRFEAEINQIKNIVEYAIVHENGKTHESLLRTKIESLSASGAASSRKGSEVSGVSTRV